MSDYKLKAAQAKIDMEKKERENKVLQKELSDLKANTQKVFDEDG